VDKMAAEESRRLFVFAAPKAGMESAEMDRVGQVTLDMSKNSSYYQNEVRKDTALRQRLQRALEDPLSEHQKQLLQQRFQQYVHKIISPSSKSEFYKQLNRMWIHVDMDMFYAAVAIRDNPSLKGKPVAVGGMSMISTANYEARAFGVRSAMPGFIAKKLCPELIFVPIGDFYFCGWRTVFEG
jgi:DNA polymerase kappa